MSSGGQDAPPTLAGPRVVLRPARAEDLPGFGAILVEPDVAPWWGPYDEAGDRDELLAGWAIEEGGELVGWLGFDEEAAEQYRSVGFDIVLATRAHGRGLGPEALRLAIAHFVARGHHRFTIDPAADNARAIRAYAKVGFRPVGVLRAYERGPDGRWRDGLLMDLLADEVAGG